MAKTFNRVWHEGMTFKIKKTLPTEEVNCKTDGEYSKLIVVQAGSVLSPLRHLIFIYLYDMPNTTNTILATFAADTAILATTPKLEDHVNENALILANM